MPKFIASHQPPGKHSIPEQLKRSVIRILTIVSIRLYIYDIYLLHQYRMYSNIITGKRVLQVNACNYKFCYEIINVKANDIPCNGLALKRVYREKYR